MQGNGMCTVGWNDVVFRYIPTLKEWYRAVITASRNNFPPGISQRVSSKFQSNERWNMVQFYNERNSRCLSEVSNNISGTMLNRQRLKCESWKTIAAYLTWLTQHRLARLDGCVQVDFQPGSSFNQFLLWIFIRLLPSAIR